MNNDRRKAITEKVEALEAIAEEIQSLLEEEGLDLDNMPESLRDGEKGNTSQTAVDNMEEALDNIDSVVTALSAAAE